MSLNEKDLILFVSALKQYILTITGENANVSGAYLGGTNIAGYEYNGIVTFSGDYSGHVVVSMPKEMLGSLLLRQRIMDRTEENLLDSVGEIANTLAGNARKEMGPTLGVSVPIKMRGNDGISAKVRDRPYVIKMNWNGSDALVIVDIEKELGKQI